MNIRNKYRSNSSPVSPNFRSSFDESVTDDSSSSDLDDIFTPPSTIDMDALIANVNKNGYNKVNAIQSISPHIILFCIGITPLIHLRKISKGYLYYIISITVVIKIKIILINLLKSLQNLQHLLL